MLTTLNEKVDPGNAALVIIDWQNDFCSRSAERGSKGARQPLDGALDANAKLVRLIDEGRRTSLPIIFVATTHGLDVDSEVWLERRRERDSFRPVEGTEGAEFFGGLAPIEGEPVVIKHRWSAFINTGLQELLDARGVKSLIMAGTSANGCVEKTALDGFQLDYYIVAATDCMATSHPDARSMEATFSFGVVATSEEIISCWSKRTATSAAAQVATQS
jgi:ureidoacrylate peracid hydrolase